jgi:RNA polymerase sigma-70 factor (sigma-E family)
MAADGTTRWTADEAVTRLFAVHYRPLVRLAHLLLADTGRAEEIVSDAYVALHANWRRLADPDKALAYLRATVVNRSRSALRHRRVAERYLVRVASAPLETAPAADRGALDRLAQETVMAAVDSLPARQREAIVLRYYGDLSEAEIADAMGCSRGAVKSHTARGVAALRGRLDEWQRTERT